MALLFNHASYMYKFAKTTFGLRSTSHFPHRIHVKEKKEKFLDCRKGAVALGPVVDEVGRFCGIISPRIISPKIISPRNFAKLLERVLCQSAAVYQISH